MSSGLENMSEAVERLGREVGNYEPRLQSIARDIGELSQQSQSIELQL